MTQLKHLASDRDAIGKVCTRTAATSDYSSTVAKMNKGPKTRGQDRKSYLTRDGSVTDVYPLILRAISLDPPELTQRTLLLGTERLNPALQAEWFGRNGRLLSHRVHRERVRKQV